MSLLIQLSWPAKALSPNHRSRSHWPRTNALKAARKEGYLSTLEAMGKGGAPKWSNPRFAFVITAYPPDRRARDDDNLIASIKPFRDGIAQALGVDDSRFDTRLQWGEPVKGGKIIVEVSGA